MRLVANVSLIACCLVAAIASPSAQAPAPAAATDPFVSGYARDLRGEVGRHDSPHPGIASVLVARAADPVNHDIAWETVPTPEARDGPIEFALIFGMSATPDGQPPSRWDMYVGDAKVQTIESAPRGALAGRVGGTVSTLTVPRVEWRLFWVDRHGDQVGHLYVTVPRALYSPGRAVRMRIVAAPGSEATPRDAWLMVFRAEAHTRVAVRAEPALLRGIDGQPEQQMQVAIAHFGAMEGASVSIALAGSVPTDNAFAIDDGYVTLRVPMPTVSAATTAAVTVRIGTRVVFDGTVPVMPVKPVTIYLLHHSHLDIGYTHVQRDVAAMQAKNLEQALDLIDKTRAYPADARFKWNVEGFWSVEAFLAQATPEQRARLRQAMQARQIEIGPLYGNMLTGLSQPEELTRMTEAARRFAREVGVPMASAWISDVPGYSWGVVPAMVQNGIKYFSLGTNTGDRIGHIIERLGDRPFYWRSASGQERLLCWLHASGYSYFHTGLSYTNRTNLLNEEKLLGYLRQVQAPDRPSYDMLPLRYNIGSDNGPPDDRLSDLVRDWNEKYVSPHLVVSTMTEFFSAFEQRHGAELPVYAGELTPYWEDGAYSTARESIANQAASARLEQAETFWALGGAGTRAPVAFPADRFREAWRNVLLFNEHTWGSWNSISAPESPFTKAQWETKRAFAMEAERQSTELLAASLGGAATVSDSAAPTTSIDVYNSLSWPRTDLVTVPAGYRPAGDRVIDALGRPVPSQRLSTGELVFLASNVPAMAAKRFRFVVAPGDAAAMTTTTGTVVADEAGSSVSAGGFSVALDQATGAIRSITGVALKGGANQYLYQAGRQPGDEHTQAPANVRITVGERGPLVASLIAESTAPGTNQLRQEVRIVAGLPRVEIVNTIDKRNIYDPEAVYFAFPFDIADPQTRLGLVHGFYRPEAQQLPGSCKNYFTVRNWLDVSNADHGVTLVTPDALMVELGKMTTDANRVGWIEQTSDSSIVYSYAMNNFWGTNYKAGQDGVTTFRYRLVPHAKFDGAAAYKAGLEANHPLVLAKVTPVTRKSSTPLRAPFRLRSRNVIISSLVPSDDGKQLIVTLFNAGDRPERPMLEWRKPARPVGRKSPPPPLTLARMPAFGVLKVTVAR